MSTSYKPSKGELLELRLARLLFAEGAFVRRSVDLRSRFGSEFTVTDLDVMSLRFGADLSVSRTIGECKSGTARGAAKASDRLLWGRGLRELMGADRHLVVTTRKVGADVRDLAGRLGAEVLDERDLLRREELRRLGPHAPYGSHDPDLLGRVRAHYAAVRGDDQLKRAWHFALADGWMMEPVSSLKRAMGACQLLARRHSRDTTKAEAEAIEWLLWQSALVFCVAVVLIAGDCYRQPPELFESWLLEELASGTVSAREMERISHDVDEYVLALLTRLGASPAQKVDALGALAPEPPRYAEQLLELIRRLAGEPEATAELPRALDWRIGEHSLRSPLDPAPGGSDTDRLMRTLAAFLRGQARVPSELLAPLGERANTASVGPSTSGDVPDERSPGQQAERNDDGDRDDEAPSRGPKGFPPSTVKIRRQTDRDQSTEPSAGAKPGSTQMELR